MESGPQGQALLKGKREIGNLWKESAPPRGRCNAKKEMARVTEHMHMHVKDTRSASIGGKGSALRLQELGIYIRLAEHAVNMDSLQSMDESNSARDYLGGKEMLPNK